MKKQVRFAIQKMVFVMAVVLIVLSGCKKGSTPEPTPPKEDLSVLLTKGKWNVASAEIKVGQTWKNDALTVERRRQIQFVSATFAKGTVEVTNEDMGGTKKFSGTWTLTGQTLLVDPGNLFALSYSVETLDKNSLVISFATDEISDSDGNKASAMRLKFTH